MVAEYRGQELKQPLEIDKLQYLVVGTGRSGTVYMAKLMTSIGFPCGHEAIFDNTGWEAALARLRKEQPIEISLIAKLASMPDEGHGVNWFWKRKALPLVADASYMAAPFLDKEELKDVTIIHTVREPMRVINSFISGFEYFQNNEQETMCPYHNFIYTYVPEVKEMPDPVSRAALYYLRWNEMIEKKSKGHKYFRHRVENTVMHLFKLLRHQETNEILHQHKSQSQRRTAR